MASYDFQTMEAKWRARWEEWGFHRTDLSQTERKLYCLVMYCYPSSDKLHLGHWFCYGPTDTWARFKRMQGYNVFHPVGFDAFGLPAENYAIKTGIHPAKTTAENITFIREQIKTIGAMYDWSRELSTCDPAYYRWNQWLFLELYKHGLAYRKEAPVNWCPGCQTVLANEQVVDGVCERCETRVTHKDLTQWFFKITAYADRLLEGLEHLDWPEKTKLMQRNWIDRSEGTEILFRVHPRWLKARRGHHHEVVVRTFTTRADTLCGATFLVLAPEHPLVDLITQPEQWKAVVAYREEARRKSELERTALAREKTGVFTGATVLHPLADTELPAYVADYVLMSYGSGAIMGVPAHDERDLAFATAFGLPIRKVILEPGTDPEAPLQAAYLGPGRLIQSGEFDGLSSEEGQRAITDLLQERGLGGPRVNYRLRDWLISRQRYWGTPIPIIFCQACGEVPVPEQDLPVLLPSEVDFLPKGGRSPLSTAPVFLHTTCPRCGQPAQREVDTMDTFVDSAWYYLRYLDPHLETAPWPGELVARWCPVDMYVGGAEHATLHLLYARFICQALHGLGHLPFPEPFLRLRHQGQITNRGARMSKSRGNVVNPDGYVEQYGSDTLRGYLMFGFAYEDGGDWDDRGIQGIHRFLNRVWRLTSGHRHLWHKRPAIAVTPPGQDGRLAERNRTLNRIRHRAIHGVTEDLERMHYNTAMSRLMELTNGLYQYSQAGVGDSRFFKEVTEDFLRLLAPFAPHLAEELWEMTGHRQSIFRETWPVYDPAMLVEEEVTLVIQINGKIRDQLRIPRGLPEEEVKQRALGAGRIPGLLQGRPVRRVVVVPDKLVNIVIVEGTGS